MIFGGSEVGLETDEVNFQNSFFPVLAHLYVFPETTDIFPTFEQATPALVAAFIGVRGRSNVSSNTVRIGISLLITLSCSLLDILDS